MSTIWRRLLRLLGLSFLALAASLLLAACSTAGQDRAVPSATAPGAVGTSASDAAFLDQLTVARSQWQALQITRYRVVFQFYENFGRGYLTEREVTVHDGQVEKASCASDECPAFVLADVYTIDDLFRIASGGSLPGSGSSLEACLQEFSWDLKHHFPQHIAIDCPEWADEDNWVKVVEFESLP